MHPAKWKTLTPNQRFAAVLNGEADPAVHWKVTRVAELTGLDPEELDWHVGAKRGWEPHDEDYLHQVIVSARQLLADGEQ